MAEGYADTGGYDSLDNFSYSEDELDRISQANSSEIPIQADRPTFPTARHCLDRQPSTSIHQPIARKSTRRTVPSSKKKNVHAVRNSGQTTPSRAAETEMTPAHIIPHDADLSSSDDSSNEGGYSSTTARVRGNRKKRPRDLSDKDNSLTSIEDIKSMLLTLCRKVDRNNKTLKEIEKQQCSISVSSSSGAVSSRSLKRTIPLAIRQEVRKCYKALLDSEEKDFSGWCLDLGVSIKSDQNESVVQKVVKEVRGLNPTFDAADIRAAAYRFYKSKCEEASLKRKGREAIKKTQRRRYERIARKRKERESAILKNSKLTEDQRKKWLTVMTNEYMSSEESADEDSIIVHPLAWRSEYVNHMFMKIDTYTASKKSPQARRQIKVRRSGTLSSRPKPDTDQPSWAIA